jgi:hypothetical protein
VLHSADIDVYLEGVMRRPTSQPPWAPPAWDRYRRARRREPSALAKVLLDLHPAFASASPDNPGWLDVERAETLALEWTSFTPHEVAQWLSAHPTLSARQARTLTEQGWQPGNADEVLPDRTIDLNRRLSRVPRTG